MAQTEFELIGPNEPSVNLFTQQNWTLLDTTYQTNPEFNRVLPILTGTNLTSKDPNLNQSHPIKHSLNLENN
jgi:hypothetical protein